VKKYRKKIYLKRGNVYFDSWFQRIQSIITCPGCNWDCLEVVQDGGIMWHGKTIHFMVDRKQTEREVAWVPIFLSRVCPKGPDSSN
jgi:anaerobic selenocysteine-containing dehydrogenase